MYLRVYSCLPFCRFCQLCNVLNPPLKHQIELSRWLTDWLIGGGGCLCSIGFSRMCIVGTVQYVAFSYWPLPLHNMHLNFSSVFASLDISFIFTSEWPSIVCMQHAGCTLLPECRTSGLLPLFDNSWMKLLWVFVYRFLCGHKVWTYWGSIYHGRTARQDSVQLHRTLPGCLSTWLDCRPFQGQGLRVPLAPRPCSTWFSVCNISPSVAGFWISIHWWNITWNLFSNVQLPPRYLVWWDSWYLAHF